MVNEPPGEDYQFNTTNQVEKLCCAWLYCWLNKIPYPCLWDNEKDTDLFSRLTIESFGDSIMRSKVDFGSMNHYILRNAVRLAYAYEKDDKINLQLAKQNIQYWFESQLVNGHGWFADKDETTSPGFTKLHIIAVCAIYLIECHYNVELLTNIASYCTDWLRSQMAIFSLCFYQNHIYLPGIRSKPYGKMLESVLYEYRYNRDLDNVYRLLVSNSVLPAEDSTFYEIKNSVGYPANFASYLVGKLIINPFNTDLESNLPRLGHTLKVISTEEGFIAYYDYVPAKTDWIHWSVKKLRNSRIATEVVEFEHSNSPNRVQSIPNGKILLQAVVDINGTVIQRG